MEPRRWQWIQGAVIAAAAAIGIAVAVWYQNRPLAMPVHVGVARLRPGPRVLPDTGIITGLASDKPPVTAAPSQATPGNKESLLATGPSQSPANAWQKEAVDPVAHTEIPPLVSSPAPGMAQPPGTGTIPIPTDAPSSPPATIAPAPGSTSADSSVPAAPNNLPRDL